jgi:hypothetical protein
VLRPDNPLFHAPDARLRLAQPAHHDLRPAVRRCEPRGKGSLDGALDRAVGNWQLLASGLREDGRMDVAVSGTPAAARSRPGPPTARSCGARSRLKDAWNDFTLAVWGPGGDAEMKREADILTAQVR